MGRRVSTHFNPSLGIRYYVKDVKSGNEIVGKTLSSKNLAHKKHMPARSNNDTPKGEEFFKTLDGVTDIALSVGGAFPRFMLTYGPENPSSSYGQFIVTTDDYKKISTLIPIIENKLPELFPGGVFGVKRIRLGPGEGGKVQVRISGPDTNVVRALAKKA